MKPKGIDLKLLEETKLNVTFSDGKIKEYDMSSLFDKYPQLKALNDYELFKQAKLIGNFGIVWNDELDIDIESIYYEGKTIGFVNNIYDDFAEAFHEARLRNHISQKELSKITKIDQGDISKIESGLKNPSVSTLNRLAEGMGCKLNIDFIDNDNIYTLYDLSLVIDGDFKFHNEFFKDWLDRFYLSPLSIKELMIKDEPKYIDNNKVFMCYLAATAEYLSKRYYLETPKWVFNKSYYLKNEYYINDAKSKEFRDYLINNTSIEFTSRNLYIGIF